jgi:hypothetical protein
MKTIRIASAILVLVVLVFCVKAAFSAATSKPAISSELSLALANE